MLPTIELGIIVFTPLEGRTPSADGEEAITKWTPGALSPGKSASRQRLSVSEAADGALYQMKRSGGGTVTAPVRLNAGLGGVPGHGVSITHVPFSQGKPGGNQGQTERLLIFCWFMARLLDSLQELREMGRDAVSCHFDPVNKPNVIRLHMVRDEVIPA
jgi:hypothetical protein